MALKLRRRQKLFPGFYLNFSSKGISTTVGIKGLNVNFNKTGRYLNLGIPGTGLYDRKKIGGNSKTEKQNIKDQDKYEQYLFLPEKLEGEIKSKDASEVTSKGLLDLKETLLAAYEEKKEIENEIIKVKKQVESAKIIKIISKILIIGLFIKWFNEKYNEKNEYLNNLTSQLNECKVQIEIKLDNQKTDNYNQLKKAFVQLSKCNNVWDMTASVENIDNRSSASNNVTRDKTDIGFKTIKFINADYEAMYFKNINGSDIYIYPGFIVLFNDKNNFGLVELKDLEIIYSNSNFLEEENVPNDADVIGSTWAKVNKNGTPDKRFKGNYEIPIVRYGELKFKSETGIYEVFLFSNADTSKIFSDIYEDYK